MKKYAPTSAPMMMTASTLLITTGLRIVIVSNLLMRTMNLL